MFNHVQPDIANFRSDYAKGADFCEVLERDMKPLYLLTFLLTTNHKDTEQCFGAVVEETFEENRVFKAWVRPWVKRCLIRKAIQMVFSRPARDKEEQNLWWEELGEPELRNVINAVIGLDTRERFAYVMSILEGYSAKDCSLLLDCTMESAVRLRVQASCRLAASDPLHIGTLPRLFGRRESA
jgi:DNA-directed RNA polymerase specialized sigma24 family protein